MPTKNLLFVVDTDTPDRNMMAGWLQDQGYRVKVFDNFDYMAKPVDKVRLKTNFDRAIEMHTMVTKIQRLQGELKKTY